MLNDIGNPIAAIDGIAQAMRDAMSPAERDAVHPLCDPLLILQQTRRLQLITRQIAELAAPPSTERRLLNLNETVNSTLLLHFDARMSGVRVRTELDPQLPALFGVGDALVQLLMNLLVNAADALADGRPAQPMIVVETVADGKGGVVMRVIDNGVGMNAPLLQRAFEPMFTTKPPGRGTGLGLPLCRRIAAEHGGRIEPQSMPGAGTVAKLLLPAAPSA